MWLANWTNKWKGYAYTYWVLAVFVFAALAFLAIPLKHLLIPAPLVTAHWWYLPHVPELMPDNEYIVLHMDMFDPLYGTRSRYTFCMKGHKIDFDEGEMVKDVVFRNHDDCVELVSYNYERESFPPYPVKHYPEEAFNAARP